MLELLKLIGLLPFLSGTLETCETFILLFGLEYRDGVLLLSVSSIVWVIRLTFWFPCSSIWLLTSWSFDLDSRCWLVAAVSFALVLCATFG